MTETNKETRKLINDAITVLERAKANATGSQQRILLKVLKPLRLELIEIDTRNLANNNETYIALTEDIKTAKSKLDKLTAEIKQLIEAAETAAQIAGTLVKLISFAARIAV